MPNQIELVPGLRCDPSTTEPTPPLELRLKPELLSPEEIGRVFWVPSKMALMPSISEIICDGQPVDLGKTQYLLSPRTLRFTT